eukprot:RCo052674
MAEAALRDLAEVRGLPFVEDVRMEGIMVHFRLSGGRKYCVVIDEDYPMGDPCCTDGTSIRRGTLAEMATRLDQSGIAEESFPESSRAPASPTSLAYEDSDEGSRPSLPLFAPKTSSAYPLLVKDLAHLQEFLQDTGSFDIMEPDECFSFVRVDITLSLAGVLDLALADVWGLPLETPLVVLLKFDPGNYPDPSSVSVAKCFYAEGSFPFERQLIQILHFYLLNLGQQFNEASQGGAGPRLQAPHVEVALEVRAGDAKKLMEMGISREVAISALKLTTDLERAANLALTQPSLCLEAHAAVPRTADTPSGSVPALRTVDETAEALPGEVTGFSRGLLVALVECLYRRLPTCASHCMICDALLVPDRGLENKPGVCFREMCFSSYETVERSKPPVKEEKVPGWSDRLRESDGKPLWALLKAKVPIDSRDYYGLTPLICATKEGREGLCQRLLESHADANAAGKEGVPPLLQALPLESDVIFRELLHAKADPNIMDKDGKPIVLLAVRNIRRLKDLMRHGLRINPNAVDKEGNTALHLASGEGNYEVCDELLLANANPNLFNNWGSTPLLQALARGFEGIGLSLVRCNADPLVVDSSGKTPFEYAVCGGMPQLCEEVLKRRIDPNLRDQGGRSLILCAARRGHMEVCRILLQGRADPNLCDRDGMCLLSHGSAERLEEFCVELLQAKALPNGVVARGCSPLLHAVSRGYEVICKVLLDEKADPNASCMFGCTPLLHVLQATGNGLDGDHVHGLDTPSSRYSADRCRDLLRAAHARICKELLEAKANPDASDTSGSRPLVQAASAGLEGACKILLFHRADPNLPGQLGRTPLHQAAAGGFAGVCQELGLAKADPNLVDNLGFTALLSAAFHRNADVVEVLLETKADVHAVDGYGRSSLWFSALLGMKETCTFLLKAKADVLSGDAQRPSPWLACCKMGHAELIPVLAAAISSEEEARAGGEGLLQCVRGAPFGGVRHSQSCLPQCKSCCVCRSSTSGQWFCGGQRDESIYSVCILCHAKGYLTYAVPDIAMGGLTVAYIPRRVAELDNSAAIKAVLEALPHADRGPAVKEAVRLGQRAIVAMLEQHPHPPHPNRMPTAPLGSTAAAALSDGQ